VAARTECAVTATVQRASMSDASGLTSYNAASLTVGRAGTVYGTYLQVSHLVNSRRHMSTNQVSANGPWLQGQKRV